MHVFATAIVGAAVGAAGNALMPARHSGGLITTVALGITGANMVAALGWLMDFWAEGSLMGYAAGVGGSLVMLIGYRMFAGPSTE
ncbi:MAG: GlsB/YeaQ/YmgE family stress response membrane protein [Acidobacteria bacterium]|nr:GlsB/YeaQ/YmgE family stress response membrane protein [Acidobacteriota bacterium]